MRNNGVQVNLINFNVIEYNQSKFIYSNLTEYKSNALYTIIHPYSSMFTLTPIVITCHTFHWLPQVNCIIFNLFTSKSFKSGCNGGKVE